MAGSRRSRSVTAEEAQLWRTVMRDAVAFPGRLPPVTTPPAVPPPAAAEPVKPPPPPPQAPPAPRHAIPYARLDHGKTPGVDRGTADRMRQGEMVIDATLDLHGMTQDAAHAALARFVVSSWERGCRCLLVITGKGNREGTGVLRAQVPRWLNEPVMRARLLAFSHAQPRHGGEGALYVLLKRRR